MKKLGRPVLPKGEARARIVPVRFSEREVQKITRMAEKRKQSISAWIRERVVA